MQRREAARHREGRCCVDTFIRVQIEDRGVFVQSVQLGPVDSSGSEERTHYRKALLAVRRRLQRGSGSCTERLRRVLLPRSMSSLDAQLFFSNS